ncbi:MAG: ROK family protein [Mobilitalea sp.]
MRIAVLDIGGTSIKSGVWDGTCLQEYQESDTEAVLGGVCVMELAKKILKSYHDFNAIGISTAGQVNSVKGVIHYANDNLPGYTGMEVRRILEEEFRVPVTVENDVNAAAIGESRYGAAKGIPDFLCLTYGTGVGGAVVINHEIYSGSEYSGGAFGGILTHPEAVEANVDFSGCYEKYASVTALVKKAVEVDHGLMDGRKVFNAFYRPEIREIIDSWIDEMVNGLVSLIHIFNPSCIILGGGIMEQSYIIEEVNRRIPTRVVQGFKNVKICRADLGNRAGLIGVAYMAGGGL